MTTMPVFLSGESHGQRSLVCYSPCHHKDLDMTEVTWHVLGSSGPSFRKFQASEKYSRLAFLADKFSIPH